MWLNVVRVAADQRDLPYNAIMIILYIVAIFQESTLGLSLQISSLSSLWSTDLLWLVHTYHCNTVQCWESSL